MSIASPIADSAAATVKINKENTCPVKSSKYTENKTKLRFTLNKIISIHIKIIKTLLLFNKIPNEPIKKSRILVIS